MPFQLKNRHQNQAEFHRNFWENAVLKHKNIKESICANCAKSGDYQCEN